MTMRALAALSLLVLSGGFARAQTVAAAPKFEAADVHVSAPQKFPFMHGGTVQGGRYAVRTATMVDLISTAYGVDAANVQGGPTWLERDRYDVMTKVPDKTTLPQAKLMLRALLAERFGLVVKDGMAPMPAYVLTVGSGKPKMTEAESADPGACVPQPPAQNPPAGTFPPFLVKCHGMTMEAFAKLLQAFGGGYFGSDTVVDETNLKGAWDFDLRFSFKQQLAQAGKDGISLIDAVDKQLGLKLEEKTAPRPVFLVESVNRTPSANPAGTAEALPPFAVPQFEVATIKPSAPDEKGYGRITGGQVELRATPLMFLVMFTWDLNQNDKESLVGAPKWLDVTKFDILAKAGANVRMDTSPGGPLIDFDDLRAMLKQLLAERFQMKVHMEDRPETAYTLVAANPKLKPAADPKARTKCKEGPGPDGKDPRIASPVLNRLLTCQNITMAEFGDELQRTAAGYVYNAVQDGTGLKGGYDLTLSFSSADKVLPGDAPTTSEPNGALSLFDAMKQLGLKLEKVKRPSPVLVIDHMDETPTEN
jgi:uncharacterized protein (TIGR03435 family)